MIIKVGKSFVPLNRVFHYQSRCFKCLPGSVDESSGDFRDSIVQMNESIQSFQQLSDKFKEGGGDRSMKNHTIRNKKLLPRDRMARLFDDGKYFEMGRLAGYAQSYGDVPQAGAITAFGKISGRICLALVNDATVKGGTLYPISVRKNLRFHDIAKQNRLPTVYVVDSGGAFLPLQAEIFPDSNHGGRAFYNEAILQSMRIPQLAVVMGSCTAGGAYIPMMCEEAGLVERIGHVFLGGPPLVKAATGEDIDAEALGGAWMHSNVSGCSDHFFTDESEAFLTVRSMVATLPDQIQYSTNQVSPADPIFPLYQLNSLMMNRTSDKDDSPEFINVQRAKAYQILARIVDGSSFLEFKQYFGKSLISGFARLDGRMVGVLISFDHIYESDAIKASHFVQLCESRGLPLILLVHTRQESKLDTEDADDYDYKCSEELKAKSKMMTLIATTNSPKITVVIGDAVGWDYYLMGGKCMEPHFSFAWPNAKFGLLDENHQIPFTSLQAAGNCWIDDVIMPSDSRQILIKCLTIIYQKTTLHEEQLKVKPVIRM